MRCRTFTSLYAGSARGMCLCASVARPVACRYGALGKFGRDCEVLAYRPGRVWAQLRGPWDLASALAIYPGAGVERARAAE